MRRIAKLALLALLVFGIMLQTVSCAVNQKQKRYEAEFLELFDTVTKIVGYSVSKETFAEQAQMIYDELKIYHELFDIYHDYSGVTNIKTINENAGIAPVKVDPRIINMLLFSREAYTLTGGKVNIAFGSVLHIWHDYRIAGIDDPESARVPPIEELKAASTHTDIERMEIDEEKSTVYLQDPEMRLDVGAIAKGYSTEMVARYAEEKGVTNLLLSVGGNVRAIGDKGKDLGNWNVGVQNPDPQSEESNLILLSLSEMSLVTSGNYERFYTVDGKRYHHIIDPVTLFPSEYYTAVTILTKDSGFADALSTAVYNMPYTEGLEFIEKLEGTEALWVMHDGDLRYSSGFSAYIKQDS